jgi:transcriptional regulator with XRE-family HTH domain
MTTMGKRLRRTREARNLSQVQLADAIKIKQSSLSDLETGATKDVSGRVLLALCKKLKVRPEWLLNNDGDVNLVPLSQEEVGMIVSYQNAPEHIREAIDVLLSPSQAEMAKTIPSRR